MEGGKGCQMPVTLTDVARRAGVSPATASRVLNGRRYVAAATRTRVEEAAHALDYVPNRAARDLSTARTETVTLLVHHAQYPAQGEGTFTSRVVDGLSRALRAARYDLLYVPVDDRTVERLSTLAAVRAGRSDAVLALGPAFPRRAIASLVEAGRPLVLIDNRHPDVDAVLAENRPAMAELARHLVGEHEYARLAVLAGPGSWPSSAERVAGARLGAGASAEVRIMRAAETTMRQGSDLAAELLDDPPDAVMAVNDAMAIGALHRFRSLPSARRPAVTGFDDIAWARLTDPPLTTVAVDAAEIGRAAAELLASRIERPATSDLPAREVRVPATVRIRRSCGCRAQSRAGANRIDPGGEAWIPSD